MAENSSNGRICTRFISGPAAWERSHFAGEDDWQSHLDADDHAELARALDTAVASGRSLDRLRAEDFPLPSLGYKLAEVVRELEFGRGFVVLQGFPLEAYSLDEIKILYRGVAAHMGTAVSQNGRGEVIAHVRNYDKGALSSNSVRVYETSAAAPFHTDSSDIVGLLCLQNAPVGGHSYLASSMTIHNHLLRHHRELLGIYYAGFIYDRRTEELADELPYYRHPVYSWFNDMLTCRYYLRYYAESAQEKTGIALGEVERQALQVFEATANLEKYRIRMELVPGDLQLVNNNVIVHARSSFQDGPDQRRDLLRVWFNTPHARDLAPGFGKFRFGMPATQ